jgi:hypothetical protein
MGQRPVRTRRSGRLSPSVLIAFANLHALVCFSASINNDNR